MRLWSINPEYLDPKGLVALWREALLAQAVLGDLTKGYRNHPQLDRFRKQENPRSAVSQYLLAVQTAAQSRGYSFDKSKIGVIENKPIELTVTSGQIEFEWQHLLAKLEKRSPDYFLKCKSIKKPLPHPMFKVIKGEVESWERI